MVDNAVFSFEVQLAENAETGIMEGMTNAASLVPSAPIGAEWTTKDYADVCKYEGLDGPYTITTS